MKIKSLVDIIQVFIMLFTKNIYKARRISCRISGVLFALVGLSFLSVIYQGGIIIIILSSICFLISYFYFTNVDYI